VANADSVKSKLTYKGPLALYVSYFFLLALSLVLVGLSFRVDTSTPLFFQLLFTGLFSASISFVLILYSTQIKRKIDTEAWRKNADIFYNDEGVFEYTHNGFTIITQKGKELRAAWKDIIRIESHDSKMDNFLRIFYIDLYFSEKDFITVDSTMPGFRLFERRLKENMREIWNGEIANPALEKKAAKYS
jgi:hypothetical protein